MKRVPPARLSFVLCAGFLLFSSGCDSGTPADAQSNPNGTAHFFPYDSGTRTFLVRNQPVAAKDVQRDLNGSLCRQCHGSAVVEVKQSTHYTTAAPTERVWFPGGGAHGMLDRACGLPATTGLTNYSSDVNLGECAKCHVGRYQPMMEGMFAGMFQQFGLPDPAGQARRLVDAGIDCLICHAAE
ncbi:MAG: hypothetical protein FJ265_10050, partial [Planctomycetes bacterium]|nr:hypothetical protein [Planctomycetota bacterium]